MQVLAGDPAADPAEVELLRVEGGHRTLLMVPIVGAGRDVRADRGVLAPGAAVERAAINRARIVSAQLGAVLAGLDYSRRRRDESSARKASSSALKRAGRSTIGT